MAQSRGRFLEKLNRYLRRTVIFIFLSPLILLVADIALASEIENFRKSPHLGEQELTFRPRPEIRIHINAPRAAAFDPAKLVGIALFALPKGICI